MAIEKSALLLQNGFLNWRDNLFFDWCDLLLNEWCSVLDWRRLTAWWLLA
jgi:hypothetical protein